MLEMRRHDRPAAPVAQWTWLVVYWCGIVLIGVCLMALGGMAAS